VTGGVFGRAAWGSEPYFDAVQARGEDGARRSMDLGLGGGKHGEDVGLVVIVAMWAPCLCQRRGDPIHGRKVDVMTLGI
jgi:hypothetical protein